MLPVVVVHSGAGTIPRDRAELRSTAVQEAVRGAYSILQSGGCAMDAVVKAVTMMENNPVCNAGRGSTLTINGTVEMDAFVMDGKILANGAVSAVKRIANPVQLARLVMDKTSHVCLTAEGASQFARAMGIPEVPEESLITDYTRMCWGEKTEPDANPIKSQMDKMGTVGAVALDMEGNVACATSTGGMRNKMEGRVGDTPFTGCGGYADNQIGAVSLTGYGEAIIKVCLARLILFHMEQGRSPREASNIALAYMKERVQGLAGGVVVDNKGNWSACFSSNQMVWAAAQQEQLHYGFNKGEDFTEPI